MLKSFIAATASTFKSTLNNGTGLTLDENYSDFEPESGSNRISTTTIPHKSHSSTRSTDEYKAVYTGTKTGSKNSPWTVQGAFAIEITEYNELYGGTFNYVSTVTVELTVDVVNEVGN